MIPPSCEWTLSRTSFFVRISGSMVVWYFDYSLEISCRVSFLALSYG